MWYNFGPVIRGVAQPGSASALGAECRRFKSSRPDQIFSLKAVNGSFRVYAEAEYKSADLEQRLTVERQMRASAETECDRLRGEVLRLRNDLEDALTAPRTGNGDRVTGVDEPVCEIRVQGLLVPPATEEVFPGEVREHILAVLSEGLEAAQSSERERRANVLEDVLAANKPGSELERRRRVLKQIIKDTGSFVDARTIAALEMIGFKCVSGNKHWKLDYANVRIPISKTLSDRRGAQNTATDIANRCF